MGTPESGEIIVPIATHPPQSPDVIWTNASISSKLEELIELDDHDDIQAYIVDIMAMITGPTAS